MSHKENLLIEMTKHPGRNRAIGMAELYELVYGEACTSKINGTRKLRKLITELREGGTPICSLSDGEGGGYYLASAASELDAYCKRLRGRALRALALEAKMRKQTLPQLLSAIQLNLQTSQPRAS